jgi:hypothetical protein
VCHGACHETGVYRENVLSPRLQNPLCRADFVVAGAIVAVGGDQTGINFPANLYVPAAREIPEGHVGSGRRFCRAMCPDDRRAQAAPLQPANRRLRAHDREHRRVAARAAPRCSRTTRHAYSYGPRRSPRPPGPCGQGARRRAPAPHGGVDGRGRTRQAAPSVGRATRGSAARDASARRRTAVRPAITPGRRHTGTTCAPRKQPVASDAQSADDRCRVALCDATSFATSRPAEVKSQDVV